MDAPVTSRSVTGGIASRELAAMSRRPSGPWLESPAWDSFWLLSGLWLLGLILVAQGMGAVPRVPDTLELAGSVLLWGGHILSPVIASWSNRDLRAHMIGHVPKFVVLPLSVFAISIGLGALGDLRLWPGLSREVTRHLNPGLVLFYAFLLWNTWHSAAQHFGVLAIYRRVAGHSAMRDRWLDRSFSVGMTCVLLPLAWYAQYRKDRLGQLFWYLPAPSDFPDLSTAIVLISAGLTVLYIAIEASKRNASLPRALYILSIGIQPVFGTIAYPLYHVAIFSICHWLVALGLASRILGSQAPASERRLLVWARRIVGPGAATWLLLLALVSVVMFLVFRSKTHGLFGTYTQASYGILAGAYFGISFVHFAYDRYLYGFSRPEIRKWVAPHLFSPTTADTA